MQIGLVSDTHGCVDLVETLTGRFLEVGISTVLHAGDVTRLAHLDPLLNEMNRVELVRGNCDRRLQGPEEWEHKVTIHGRQAVFEFDEQVVGLTHGHLDSALRALRTQENLNILVRGHTHERRDEVDRGIRHVNPGAVKPPNPSAALYDTESREVSFLDL